MIRYLLNRPTTDGKFYAVIAGLSTDAKPTANLITGSRFVAADTGARYMFDESAGQWNETDSQDQIDAAVQAWLEDHPEAIDQAAIEAMFGDQLDGIESDLSGLKSDISILEPSATSSDVGKFLKAKTVSGGKVTEYEFGSGGGSGGTDDYSDLSNKPQINGVTLTGNKSLADIGAVSYTEEELLRDEMPGTSTTVTMDSNGNPTSIVHTANGTTLRTDTFVWGTGTVTETRTLANGKYITITTNLETLAQTISAMQEVA